jgi:hypothetical protein
MTLPSEPPLHQAPAEAVRTFTQMLSADRIHDFDACLAGTVSATATEFGSTVSAFTQKLTADQLAQFHAVLDAAADSA